MAGPGSSLLDEKEIESKKDIPKKRAPKPPPKPKRGHFSRDGSLTVRFV